MPRARKRPNPPDALDVQPWVKSDAKAILREAILAGEVDDDMAPMDVYCWDPVFAYYKYENFRTNLRTLKEKVQEDRRRFQQDQIKLSHNLALFDRLEICNRGYLFWHTSRAKKKLKKDLEDPHLTDLKPQQLYATRISFQQFPLDVFRGHIYQEKRAKKSTSYWLHRHEEEAELEARLAQREADIRAELDESDSD
jgi:hypothetical protein